MSGAGGRGKRRRPPPRPQRWQTPRGDVRLEPGTGDSDAATVASAGAAPADALLARAQRAHEAGRHGAAQALCRQALAADPRHAGALGLLGLLAHRAGDRAGALECTRRALAAAPDAPGHRFNLAVLLREEGELEAAARALEAVCAARPDYAPALNELGLVHRAAGRAAPARACFERATRVAPREPAAWNHLGNLLGDEGRLEAAAAAFRQAVALRPAFFEAWNGLGSVHNARGEPERAIEAFRRGLAHAPASAEMLSNLGNALRSAGQLGAAIRAYRRSVDSNPRLPMSWSNLGAALRERGDLGEAERCYERALEIDPGLATARSNLLFCLHHRPDLTPEALFEAHRRWAIAPVAAPPPRPPPPRDGVLRVGYVSPDFRMHSVAWFVAPVLAGHDRRRVHVTCYAASARADDMTERLRACADAWCDAAALADDALAARIRADGIHVLVDLAGHTADNRLPVFARRPAPVQVTWLGYPGTTGMETMDYRITDAIADPPGASDRLHSERLVRLEPAFLCFSRPDDEPAPGRRADPASPPGDRRGPVLACFNNSAKINAGVARAWARILAAVPGSRLLLKARQLGDSHARAGLLARLGEAGVARDRVELAGWSRQRADHLALYRRADLALDTFPYNGTTTSCEALWMGVPVVTLAGDRHASRVGASLLSAAGLAHLVAASEREYVALARDLAVDPARLGAEREGLRERLAASPLMDAPRFVAALEGAYRRLWAARGAPASREVG